MCRCSSDRWAAATPNDWGFRAGLHVPIPGVIWPEVDGYVQLPAAWTGPLDAGIGAVLTPLLGMPYLQLGLPVGNDAALYTTQGVASLVGDADLPDVLWMPGLAVRWRGERYGGSAFVTGGICREDRPSCPPPVCNARYRQYLLSAGLMLVLHHRSTP